MKRGNTLLYILLGVAAYFLWKKSQPQPIVASAPAAPTTAPVLPMFRDEWAGSDLYRETGSVLPSGSARDLIR
jgi:hypothetical protein